MCDKSTWSKWTYTIRSTRYDPRRHDHQSPSLAVEIHQTACQAGLQSLDAPVSGGDIGAREARLSFMVGGDESIFQVIRPLFELMGKTIVYQGAAGSGQNTKLVNQTLIASNMVGVCEALLYAERAGLDLERVLQSVSPGAAGSWSLTNLAPRIMRQDFQPGFLVDHFVKDMGIVLQESQRMKLAVPGLALAHQLYVALQSMGGGRLGTQGLILAFGILASLQRFPCSRECFIDVGFGMSCRKEEGFELAAWQIDPAFDHLPEITPVGCSVRPTSSWPIDHRLIGEE